MISQRDLVDRLARRSLGGWSVVERVQDIAIADEGRRLERVDHRTRLTVIVHQDVPRGRGTAQLDVDSFDGSADDLVDQAIALAAVAVGPAWSATPPAAPAKVIIADDELVKHPLDAVVTRALGQLRRPADATVTAAIEALREKVTVIASSGFHTSWLATALRADATVTTATGHSLRVTRRARRLDDLGLDAAIANVATDLRQLVHAGPPTPGPCTVWLGPDALLHDDDHGLWAIFAHHADSAIERQGITHYRWHSEIAPSASQLAEPLTITSTGSLDYATHSVPVTDHAVAVRDFPIVERGIAVGLGLSPREAALRRTDPNGGVRNLLVARGSWSAAPATAATATPSAASATAAAATKRTIEIRRLHAVTIDFQTGEASLDIALGLEHHPTSPTPRTISTDPTPFTSGTIRLDLISALSLAQRSSQHLQRGAYHGPAGVLISDADLLI